MARGSWSFHSKEETPTGRVTGAIARTARGRRVKAQQNAKDEKNNQKGKQK
jgi:hypothetical protein